MKYTEDSISPITGSNEGKVWLTVLIGSFVVVEVLLSYLDIGVNELNSRSSTGGIIGQDLEPRFDEILADTTAYHRVL